MNKQLDYKLFIDSRGQLERNRTEACIKILQQCGIKYVQELIDHLEYLKDDQLIVGCQLLGYSRARSSLSKLLPLFQSHPSFRPELAKVIAGLLVPSGFKHIRRIKQYLEGSGNPDLEYWSAYLLTFASADDAINILLQKSADITVNEKVRCQCIESIATHVQFIDKRKKLYVTAARQLIELLDDESPSVRFWAVYALGHTGSPKVVPILQRVQSYDKGRYEGYWSVREEAANAIQFIHTGDWPDHPVTGCK